MLLMYGTEAAAAFFMIRGMLWSQSIGDKIDNWGIAIVCYLASILFHLLYYIEGRVMAGVEGG